MKCRRGRWKYFHLVNFCLSDFLKTNIFLSSARNVTLVPLKMFNLIFCCKTSWTLSLVNILVGRYWPFTDTEHWCLLICCSVCPNTKIKTIFFLEIKVQKCKKIRHFWCHFKYYSLLWKNWKISCFCYICLSQLFDNAKENCISNYLLILKCFSSWYRYRPQKIIISRALVFILSYCMFWAVQNVVKKTVDFNVSNPNYHCVKMHSVTRLQSIFLPYVIS